MATALAHRNDPDTSHIAAAALDPEENNRVKGAILSILAHQPMPVFQLTGAYFARRESAGWPFVKPDSIAKRLSELRNAGKVIDSGDRVTGQFNRPVAVWALPEPVAA
jgi:hypothetical protein